MMKRIRQGKYMRVKWHGARLWNATKLILSLGVLLSSGTLFVYGADISVAQTASWVGGQPALTDDITYRPMGRVNDVMRYCTPQRIWIAGKTLSEDRCVADNEILSVDSEFKYIKIGNDQQYYPLQGMGPGSRPVNLYSASADAYIRREGYGFGGHRGNIAIDSNMVQSLTSAVNGVGVREYQYDYQTDFILQDSNGQIPIGKAGDLSKNGRWLVVELFGKGFARIDLRNNYKTVLFSDRTLPYDFGMYAWAEMAVSDDGRYVAISDQWMPLTVYELSDNCTQEISATTPFTTNGYSSCPSVSLQEAVSSAEYFHLYPHNLEFSDSGYELLAHISGTGDDVCSNRPYGCEIWRTIRAANYADAFRLDYLALGDSYSSGEGDTERDETTSSKYYREYTDNEENKAIGQPREKCHVSTRSYPYILSQGMNLGAPVADAGTKWQTVACSGAQKHDVETKYNYSGQSKGGDEGNKPRLEGYDVANLQNIALNEFIPGRVEQLEFVKKYKPRVITLTMGGNDVGFGDKIAACATPSIFNSTCHMVATEGRFQLAKQIRNEFDNLKALYEQLYKNSGGTAKIFVLGYPSFINGNEVASCGKNVGSLNYQERELIHEATAFMNLVIEHAASAAGVKYIDIAESLSGGRLCDEGQAYMTGVTGINGWNSNQIQESFHPNAKGHQQIAMKVWEETSGVSLVEYDICPNTTENICPNRLTTKESIETPVYFEGREPEYQIEYSDEMTSGSIIKGVLRNLTRLPYSFLPKSDVTVTIFSDPLELGRYTVDDDGSLEAQILVPDSVPTGYHTLVVDGKTYSGESIRYEQVVLVKGADPLDIDENGTIDSQQKCGPFIIASGADEDFDGLDDACDPQIEDAAPLYRMRFGEVGRSYRNKPEDESTIYVERNTEAGQITGYEGDHDPDADGWAVVGVSKKSQLRDLRVSGSVASIGFEVIGDGTASNPYSPVLYVRYTNDTCLAYKPVTLKVVAPNGSRNLRIIDEGTQKCSRI